jgi:hypothetical protein
MKLVIDEVHRLAHTFSATQAYVRNVRQVRFNAWHYSDDHLWVGLVEHLFRELRAEPARGAPSGSAAPAEGPDALARARAELATAAQSRTKKILDEVDALDPDRGGWLAWLGQIRRAARASPSSGGHSRRRPRRDTAAEAQPPEHDDVHGDRQRIDGRGVDHARTTS